MKSSRFRPGSLLGLCSDEERALRSVLDGADHPNWPLFLSAVDGLGGSRLVPVGELLRVLVTRPLVPEGVRSRAVSALVRHNLLGSNYVARELLLGVLSHPEVEPSVKAELVSRTWNSHLPPQESAIEGALERYRSDSVGWAVSHSGSRAAALALELVRRYSVSPLTNSVLVELVVEHLVPEDDAVLEIFWTLLDDHLLDTWRRWRHEFPDLLAQARLLA